MCQGSLMDWAIIWALGLGLGKQSPGPLDVFYNYKSTGAVGGKASNHLPNIRILLLSLLFIFLPKSISSVPSFYLVFSDPTSLPSRSCIRVRLNPII